MFVGPLRRNWIKARVTEMVAKGYSVIESVDLLLSNAIINGTEAWDFLESDSVLEILWPADVTIPAL